MAQRDSGYARVPADLYETPAWVTDCLAKHLVRSDTIWEPACGNGKMVRALIALGFRVWGTDKEKNFLLQKEMPNELNYDSIVTNPPFNRAEAFIRRAHWLMQPRGGLVAMLLSVDFDSAKTRAPLFRDCPAFAKKIVLLNRIVWFEPAIAGPSQNHAWYIWDFHHSGPATIAYEAKAK